MLIQFSVKNYKTFAEEAKLSLIANHDKSTRFEDNVFHVPQFDLHLLKSAVIYGANASGKTKLVEAFGFMRNFILNSTDLQSKDTIPVAPFSLNTEKEKNSSSFEIIFIHEKIMYRYGFEVTKEKVMAEWLYQRPKTKEVELFYREGQDFEIHPTKFKVQDLIDKDRIKPNTLLLSKADAENDKIAKKVFEWVYNTLNIMFALEQEAPFYVQVLNLLKDPDLRKQTIELLKLADIGIDDLYLHSIDTKKEIEDIKDEDEKNLIISNLNILEKNKMVLDTNLYSVHKKYNANRQQVDYELFNFYTEESSGTRKFLVVIILILFVIKKGSIFIIDELDAKLHPNLVHKIVEIFNSKEKNPRNAQLIFNTHDTNLLSCGLFRRDQIWFTEKDRYGAASLYSLADFKAIRKEENFEKNYIEGKYGAIPYLGDFDKLFNL